MIDSDTPSRPPSPQVDLWMLDPHDPGLAPAKDRLDEASEAAPWAESLKLESRGITSHLPPALRPQQTEKQSEFWRTQSAIKFSVAAKLREAGEEALAEELEDCHSHTTVAKCQSCGKSKAFANRCDRFYCPECTPRLARERRDAVEWWVKQIRQPKHVVLTLQNLPSLEKASVQHLKKCLSKLRRTKFAKGWRGGFYSLEVTNERKGKVIRGHKCKGGWHLHVHLLVDADWVDQFKLSEEWDKATDGLGRIVKVKDVREGSYLAEVTKYAVKGSMLAQWAPDDIVSFIRAFQGVRQFGVFGSLYGKRTEFKDYLASLRDDHSSCECGCADFTYYTEHEWLAYQEGIPLGKRCHYHKPRQECD